ncbi:unnamed protein product [Acanthoscelides obtectus]|uniref:Uncharacterized protein n=1 Tax=Acanthoscelides obtectus TaxID=200917 RepID=A0A9P0JZ75_ACAOB|nr:unnamed protein product [Acanthoscelides obtectus]CAK1669587.1 hypothetical protein AOBTE_LOCUS27094 [Acanthoscelides obtectus]
MFKLVVLSALLAVACAKPSGVALAYTAPAVVAAPAAVSHTFRSDVVSKPLVAAYSAPILAHTAYAAPLVTAHAAPVIAAPLTYAAGAPIIHAF